MTATATAVDIMADDTPPLRPEPRRDQYGRYMIPDPDTGKDRPWTRATTWASSVADTYNLTKWQLRMTALGVAGRPDLVAAIATVTDPDDFNAKRKLDALCEKAKEHAGAGVKANLGTALHSVTEQVDAGTGRPVPEMFVADVAAYVQTMDDAGVVIDPSHIERIVCIPSLGVAGTFDRLLTLPGGPLRVGDLKTGKDLSYSWSEIAIQLALYANASTMFDPATGEHEPMPTVDLEQAIVMHLPVGKADCTLYELNIAAGWEMAQLCGVVRNWRKRKDLATAITVEASPLIAPASDKPERLPLAGQQADDPFTGFPAPQTPPANALPPRHESRDAWIRERLDKIKTAGHTADLAAAWPAGVTTPKKVPRPYNDTEVDAIADACWTVENKHQLDFPDQDPATIDIPVSADDPRLDEMARRLDALPADLVDQITDATTEKCGGIKPRFRSGAATEKQLALVIDLVDTAETMAGFRHDELATALAVIAPGEVEAVRAAVELVDNGKVTAAQMLCVSDIVDALQGEHVTVDGGAIRLSTKGAAAVAAKGAGKREVVAFAKPIAEARRLPIPSKYDDVILSPALAAAVVMAD